MCDFATLWFDHADDDDHHADDGGDDADVDEPKSYVPRGPRFICGKAMKVLLPLLLLLGTGPDIGDKDLDLVEFFCGCQAITRGAQFMGRKAYGVDILSPQKVSQPRRNLGTKHGFCLALKLICRLRRFGLTWWAPPCSSWVWISRATNKRSVEDPLGDENQKRVRWNNRLVSRLMILLELVRFLGLFWILEQPQSSIILEHPKFNKRLKRLGTRQKFLWMQCYGGESPKPTILYGDSKGLAKLGANRTTLTKSILEVTTQNERGQISGGKDLQGTQAYPLLLGLDVALAHFSSVTGAVDPTKGDSDASDDDDSDESYSCLEDMVELLPRK